MSSFGVFICLSTTKLVNLLPNLIMWLTIFLRLFEVWFFKKEKVVLANCNPTNIRPIKRRQFLVPPCVIPCYKIIPTKKSVRVQDDDFSGFNRLLEIVTKNWLRIHSWLKNFNSSVKDSHFYIDGMIPKFPKKRFEYMLEISLRKKHTVISFIPWISFTLWLIEIK